MTPRGLNDAGLSGTVGAVLLIVVIVAGMAILMVTVLSQPQPQKIPAMTAEVISNSNGFYLKHDGGDTLQKGQFRILVDGQDKTAAFGDPATWAIGQTLKYSDYDLQNIPVTIQIVYNGGGYWQTIEQLWVKPPTYTHGFIANYYNDETWTNLAGTRIDNEIQYANADANTTFWLHAPTDESNWPVPMVGRYISFSVTWDGYLLVTQADTYTFSLTSDDGSWLWIDERLVIDHSGSDPQVPKTGTITLTPGYHHIVVKMYQHYSLAVARLQYSSSTMSLQQVTNVWHTSTSS